MSLRPELSAIVSELLRAHEGTLRLGEKSVLGRHNVINCYLDVEIGSCALLSDWIYITDFDHDTTDLTRPIKDQGIVKAPVRIGPDCWIGNSAVVMADIGPQSIVAAGSVVVEPVAPGTIVGGNPARFLRKR